MTPRVKALLERAAVALRSAESTPLLEEIGAADVGLPELLQHLRAKEGWQEEEAWTTPSFRASLFLMPAGGTMPLHDHPGMDALLKVLWGQIRIRSYDWMEGQQALARVTSDRLVSPADGAQRLEPHRDNLHRLDAVEDSAFLDLLAPDYDVEAGRPCLYYVEEALVATEGGPSIRLRPVPT